MSSSSTVIFCESYPSIAYVLYRLEQSEETDSITVFIPTLHDLYLFFSTINEKVFSSRLKLIFYPGFTPRWASKTGIQKITWIFKDILAERRILKNFYRTHLSQIEQADIQYTSPGYSGAKIYTITRLVKKNRLTFIDPGPPYMAGYSPKSLSELLLLLRYKLTYGSVVSLGQFPPERPWSKNFPLLKSAFIRKYARNSVDWSDRNRIMESFNWEKYRVFETGGYKVVYFHQDFVERYVPDRDIFSRELNEVFSILLRYYKPGQVARKYHPGHLFHKDVITIGDELPMYIPAELLYGDNIDFYIGISSTAIANVTGGRAMSLLDIITFSSEELRQRFKKRLIENSRTPILFPASLKELDDVVRENFSATTEYNIVKNSANDNNL